MNLLRAGTLQSVAFRKHNTVSNKIAVFLSTNVLSRVRQGLPGVPGVWLVFVFANSGRFTPYVYWVSQHLCFGPFTLGGLTLIPRICCVPLWGGNLESWVARDTAPG